jgi:hypothetical protein
LKFTNDCAECNELFYLNQDVGAVIGAVELLEENTHTEAEFTTGSDYVGRRVKKEFDGKFYEGIITRFTNAMWTIKFHEDGVEEEYCWDDLKLLLLHHDKNACVIGGEEGEHVGKTVSKEFGGVRFEAVVTAKTDVEDTWHIEYDDGDADDCDWDDFSLLPKSPFSRMARARLKAIHEAGVKLKAHKCRFANQDVYKELITTHILSAEDLGLCYVLVDYWAKLPARLKDTGCCENLGKGISVLGTMFIYRNPNVAERSQISQENDDFDWTPFGTAPDDVDSPGSPDLVEFINLVDQNASQTAYHTACSMRVAFDEFKEARPWFKNKKRCFYVQSDGAGRLMFVFFSNSLAMYSIVCIHKN